MNPDLAMGDELLKKSGSGNLFMVFGEPGIRETMARCSSSIRAWTTPPKLSRPPLYPASMSRRADPEALFVARRMGLAGRLTSRGMLEHVADRWIVAWEAEARARGLDARETVFWDGAAAWIEEQRKDRRP